MKHLLEQFKNQFIKKIQKYFDSKEIFTFHELQQEQIIKIVPKNKSSTFKDIPVKNHGQLGSCVLSRSHENFG